MKNVLKKGLVILGIYAIFTAYLLFACDRIERLDKNDNTEKVNVSLKFSD